MATGDEREGQEGSRRALTVAESIKAIAARDARSDLDDEKSLLLFLKSWWSKTYNRPLKDPLLSSYTLEELLYEFYDKVERRAAEEERANLENDKIEEDKDKAVLDWAQEEEKRELERELKEQAAKQESKPDPTKDPENVAWMEEQLKQGKQLFGDSFGENIEEGFEE